MLSFLGRTFQHPVLARVPAVSPPRARFRAALRTALISMSLLFAGSAWADDFADISKHIKAGQFNEALGKVDAALVKTPKDAQLRFLKGLIYTEQNKSAEAIVIFTKMTEDFPDLPEPYNNLAVLYASAGQYDKARTALEAAIHTHPTYATAYENLGDVYAKLASQAYDKALAGENFAKLASQAYDKALQLDANNQSTKKKLALVSTMSRANASTTATAASPVQVAKVPVAKPAATPVVAASPAPATPAPAAVQLARVETKPARPEVKTEAKPDPREVAKQLKAEQETKAREARAEQEARAKADAVAAEKTRADALAASKAEAKAKADKAKAEAKEDSGSEEALATLHSWARAWSSKDVKSYLNSYASDFQTPKGESRKEWAEERRTRIESKGRINVQIEAAQVAMDNNTATIKFRQLYKSDKLSATSRKTIVMVKQGGRWVIKQEHSAS